MKGMYDRGGVACPWCGRQVAWGYGERLVVHMAGGGRPCEGAGRTRAEVEAEGAHARGCGCEGCSRCALCRDDEGVRAVTQEGVTKRLCVDCRHNVEVHGASLSNATGTAWCTCRGGRRGGAMGRSV